MRFRNTKHVTIGCSLAGAAIALAVAVIGLTSDPVLAHGATRGHHKPAIYGMPGKASEVDRTIRVLANDAAFSIDTLEIRQGETVRFVVTNRSTIDHDFTIGDAASQTAHRREMAEMMGRPGMAGMMNHDDANAVFLKPGETKELIWKFSRAGRFEFACNVPGHYEAGMKGSLTVGAHRETGGSHAH